MAFTIYLISILNSIIGLSIGIAVATPFTALIIFAIHDINNQKISNEWKSRMYKLAWVFITSLLIIIFTPSSQTAAAMYLVPKVVNNEDVQAIGENGLKALRELSGQWAEELVNKKKEK